ncbi:unnamed protein product [Vicia faba]|uniref:Fungal lipase-type domain-containing protein n=1 Tax=Vicia faba TaxID=3906 RepID=A0AAV1B6P5_VICFA|nr:unnamed protein product [Vicia faba]
MASVVPILHSLLNQNSNLPSLSHSQPLFSRSTNHKSKFLNLSRKPNNPPILLLKCSSSSSMLNKLEEKEEDGEEDDIREGELSPPPPPPPPPPPLSDVWEEIQGKNNWEGLIDPMDPILRKEIIRYGEFAQACYDSFDFDPHSKYCGTCKYHPSHFFDKLDMAESSGYTITRTHANWMGYIAVATDEQEIKRLGRRDIVIAWRGTVTYIEWIYDLKDILHEANFRNDPSIKVELGFYDLYTKKEDSCSYCTFSAREQVLSEIKRLVQYYEEEKLSITITGHSLGAALAILSAYDIAELKLNVVEDNVVPVTVYSFAGPRVGNLKFKERCDELGVKVLRILNVHDKVPTVPGIITNEKFQFQKYIEDALSFPWSYAHVGTEIALDHRESPFLKENGDLGCAHNLEVLLHLIDGYHGKKKKFELVSKRDIALVNKSCDFLLSEYGVPPHWRQDENKGMVRSGDGRWVLPERPQLEAHPPDTEHLLKLVLNYHIHVNAKFQSS